MLFKIFLLFWRYACDINALNILFVVLYVISFVIYKTSDIFFWLGCGCGWFHATKNKEIHFDIVVCNFSKSVFAVRTNYKFQNSIFFMHFLKKFLKVSLLMYVLWVLRFSKFSLNFIVRNYETLHIPYRGIHRDLVI